MAVRVVRPVPGPSAGLLSSVVDRLGRLPEPALAGLARKVFSKSWARFEAATEDPERAQLERLRAILAAAKDTELGRAHGFADIQDFATFRARVPVRTYDDFAPFLERMVAGETNVLLPESPFFYARSSGTTGKPKYVPITPRYLDEYRRPRRVWMRQVMQVFPGLVGGKILSVHSPKVEGRTPTGIPYGSITVAITGSPDLGQDRDRFGRDPSPRRAYLIEEFDRKYYVLLRMALQSDVRMVAAINPSTIVLLARKLDEHAERLAEDLEEGTLFGLEGLPEPLQGQLRARLRPDPAAADRLRASRVKHGHVLPTDVWPRIVGLLAWKGGSAPFYVEKLSRLFPGRAVMDYGFLATEGGFSIPLSADGAKGVVAVTGHVLEFVPEARAEAGDFSASLHAGELTVGERYRVLVTGSHGLVRYDINDVVECVGRHRQTAEIAFLHKGGNMISLTGEKVGEAHVVLAFAKLEADRRVRVRGFTVSAELGDPPRYLLAVELEGDASPEILRPWILAADRALAEANLEYEAKRGSLRLGPPRLLVLEPGAFERERAARVRAGAPDSHVKVPHLFRDPKRVRALGVAMELDPP